MYATVILYGNVAISDLLSYDIKDSIAIYYHDGYNPSGVYIAIFDCMYVCVCVCVFNV